MALFDTHPHIHIHIHTHTHLHIHIRYPKHHPSSLCVLRSRSLTLRLHLSEHVPAGAPPVLAPAELASVIRFPVSVSTTIPPLEFLLLHPRGRERDLLLADGVASPRGAVARGVGARAGGAGEVAEGAV